MNDDEFVVMGGQEYLLDVDVEPFDCGDVHINNNGDPECSNRHKPQLLRARLARIFGNELVMCDKYMMSPHWTVVCKFTCDGMTCLCSTPIRSCNILSHTLVPSAKANIGSTCLGKLIHGNKRLTSSVTQQKREHRQSEAIKKGHICENGECNAPLTGAKARERGWCSKKCGKRKAFLDSQRVSQNREYAHHLHVWPSLLSLYEQHSGFRAWFAEKEHPTPNGVHEGTKGHPIPHVGFASWVKRKLDAECPWSL